APRRRSLSLALFLSGLLTLRLRGGLCLRLLSLLRLRTLTPTALAGGAALLARRPAPAGPGRRPPLLRLALRAGPDHRQPDAAAAGVDRKAPARHQTAHRHHTVVPLDVAVGHLADVDQAAVLQADVDEGAEVDDVEDGPLQFHAGLEVFQLEDALLEDGRRQ